MDKNLFPLFEQSWPDRGFSSVPLWPGYPLTDHCNRRLSMHRRRGEIESDSDDVCLSEAILDDDATVDSAGAELFPKQLRLLQPTENAHSLQQVLNYNLQPSVDRCLMDLG